MTIHNGRPHADEFALERNGFRFVRHDTKVADFYDEDEIKRVYYPEMEALIKAESGAKRVVVFDHTLRTADDELRETKKIREVVRRVHNDYTEWSGPQRVRDILPDEADELLKRRFAIIQVWRPIRHPVETYPLAICDARSCRRRLIVSERRYPDRIGQTYAITYNPEHHWYWFPRMRRDEALVFKVFEFDEGRPRPLDRAHRVRRPDLAAERAAAREHRDPHAGVFLTSVARMERSEIRDGPSRISLRFMRATRISASRTGSERRALARPYFLRSTTRESRVRKPPRLSTPRSSGSK